MTKIKLIAVAFIAGFLFVAGYWLRDLQADAAELARIEGEKQARQLLGDLADRVSQDTAKAIAGIRVTNQTIHQKTIQEVLRETIYSDCVLPDAGRLLINEARAAANASIGAVPTAAATE